MYSLIPQTMHIGVISRTLLVAQLPNSSPLRDAGVCRKNRRFALLSFFSVVMYGAHGLDNPLLVNTFTLSIYS